MEVPQAIGFPIQKNQYCITNFGWFRCTTLFRKHQMGRVEVLGIHHGTIEAQHQVETPKSHKVRWGHRGNMWKGGTPKHAMSNVSIIHLYTNIQCISVCMHYIYYIYIYVSLVPPTDTVLRLLRHDPQILVHTCKTITENVPVTGILIIQHGSHSGSMCFFHLIICTEPLRSSKIVTLCVTNQAEHVRTIKLQSSKLQFDHSLVGSGWPGRDNNIPR